MTQLNQHNLKIDQEDPTTTLRRHVGRRRHLVFGASCVIVVVVLVVISLLTVVLTVYKVKDPILTINSLTLAKLAAGDFTAGELSGTGTGDPFDVNFTILADVSVKNPNAASFRFSGSTTAVYYRSHAVAVANGPPGMARARRTLRLNLTIDVAVGEIMGSVADIVGDFAAGSLGVDTSTRVGGHVRVLGVIKHHVDVVMNCSFGVAVVNHSIMHQDCKQKIWV